jgi:hypothetical protein
MVLFCFSCHRDKEKLTYEIVDLKQRAQDITFLKVTRNIQEYLSCPDDAAFEIQKQRELQMFEATIDKMKQVCVKFNFKNFSNLGLLF